MLRITYIAAATIALICGTMLAGESSLTHAEQETVGASKLNLTMEQRYTIREIVKDLKIENDRGAEQVEIGKAVPKSVHLQPMPTDIQAKVSPVKSHYFFLRANKVVIVDPKNNRIVDIIE